MCRLYLLWITFRSVNLLISSEVICNPFITWLIKHVACIFFYEVKVLTFILKEHIEEKIVRYRLKSGVKGIRLHIEIAGSHNSKITMQSISNHISVIIPHSPYSSNYALCDFWLFRKLKECLKWKHFGNKKDLFDAISKKMKI